MSKSWLIDGFQYNFNPTLKNYILSRHGHFKFCTKNDSAITASIYLDNLAIEIKRELDKIKTTNKKTLVLSTMQQFLESHETKNELIALFEKPEVKGSDVQLLLDRIGGERSNPEQEQYKDGTKSFHTRTYLIATHLYLEINDREDDYSALIKDTGALKKFISAQFNASQLSSRISYMKSFSYKDILKSKSRDSAKGQLKPQFRQIINNPKVFGEQVSRYAEKILNEDFD